jgi:hypothetical protein
LRTLGKIGEGGVFVKVILFGERSLPPAIREYVTHYHAERNHQGKSNVLLFPQVTECDKAVECRKRLGGLLRYYHRDDAGVDDQISIDGLEVVTWGGSCAETQALLMVTAASELMIQRV